MRRAYFDKKPSKDTLKNKLRSALRYAQAQLMIFAKWLFLSL